MRPDGEELEPELPGDELEELPDDELPELLEPPKEELPGTEFPELPLIADDEPPEDAELPGVLAAKDAAGS